MNIPLYLKCSNEVLFFLSCLASQAICCSQTSSRILTIPKICSTHKQDSCLGENEFDIIPFTRLSYIHLERNYGMSIKLYTLLTVLLILASAPQVNACGLSYQDPSLNDCRSIAISPDGSHIATASFVTNTVTVFNFSNGILSAGTPYKLPNLMGNYAMGVAFSPNGSYLAIANSVGVTLFAANEGVLSNGTTYPADLNPVALTFSPDGLYLAVANNLSAEVTLFAVAEGALCNPARYPLPTGSSYPQSLAFSPDGSYLATGNYGSNNVTLFSFTNGVLSKGISYPLPSGSLNPNSVSFSPDGSRLTTANEGSNDVTIFNLIEGIPNEGTSYALPAGSTIPTSLVYSPNGSYLAVANGQSNDVTVFSIAGDLISQEISYSLPIDSFMPRALTFSPDGAYLATINYSNDITIFNTAAWCSATDTPKPSKKHLRCNKMCIGLSTASVAIIAAAGIGALILKKYHAHVSSEQKPLLSN